MQLSLRRGAVAVTLFLCAVAATSFAIATSDDPFDIEIPFERFTLENGLTVIVHGDDSAPIVAVNVWYHVGSKNELPGRTGFAHLFEHLMFNGSEHFDDDYFKLMEKVGATGLNGTTNTDRTNYFQNVPKNALDLVLWAESDRMGHLLGAVTQEKLDEQRGVVQNEKRQGENRPYGVTRELIATNTYPEGHPYSWTTIGKMEDLDAASLEDVHAWFERYYGPSNAVLVVAGDVDTEAVKAKVEHYFGDIAPGPPIAHHESWVARRASDTRQRVQDRVPQARLYKVWNVPGWATDEAAHLQLASRILTTGKTSRLYKRLVYDEQLATNVSSFVDVREIGSQFTLMATARPGVPLEKVEAAIDEELARFFEDGPTAGELDRVRTSLLASLVRRLERIGGFGGKSSWLAQYETYSGDAGEYRAGLAQLRSAKATEIRDASKEWLSNGAYNLEVHPFPKYAAKPQNADREKLPEIGVPPVPKFPDFERAKLDNGLEILVAERRGIPVVQMTLMVDAGYASDGPERAGLAALTMAMLDEGTKDHDALEIGAMLDGLGARLSASSGLDASTVTLSSLSSKLDPTLDLFADVVLQPAFPEGELKRMKRQRLAQIQREKAQPGTMAMRVFPPLVFGKDHAYGIPFTGSGDERTVAGLGRDDLVKFHDTWFRPNNATLVVVGDTTLGDVKKAIDARFGDWKPAEVPKLAVTDVALPDRSIVYLMDRPGSVQSTIIAGNAAPPKSDEQDLAIDTMNRVLGGSFTSRVNMNLREDKSWSYGARTRLASARGPRPFMVTAPVQTDKTKESMVEILRELTAIRDDRPVSSKELEKVRTQRVSGLPGSWATNSAVMGALVEMVRYGYPEDYYETYPQRIHALEVDEVAGVAERVVHPDNLVWVVVGDREKIERGIRELGIGEVRVIDPNGNVLADGGSGGGGQGAP